MWPAPPFVPVAPSDSAQGLDFSAPLPPHCTILGVGRLRATKGKSLCLLLRIWPHRQRLLIEHTRAKQHAGGGHREVSIALVHKGSPVPWWWVIEEEADGVLHCTVQGPARGGACRERSTAQAHLNQPGEAGGARCGRERSHIRENPARRWGWTEGESAQR